MRRLLFLILIELIYINPLPAQEISQVKNFADLQYSKGNFKSALKEFQRVLFFDQGKEYSDIYLHIATIYFMDENFDEAYKYYDLAYKSTSEDSLKFELMLKKGLCHLKQEAYFSALYELFDIPDSQSDLLNKKKHLYLGVCYFGLNDYQNSLQHLNQLTDSAGIQSLNELFEGFHSFERKYSPNKVRLMSQILPGLGQIYIGETANGLNSFVLIGAVLYYAVNTTINYGFIDGILVLTSWFNRYYNGGYNNADMLAKNKITGEKSRIYSEIFNIIGNHER